MIIAQLQVETVNHRNTIGEQSHSIQEHTDYPLHNVMSPRRYFVNLFIFIESGEKKRVKMKLQIIHTGFKAKLQRTCRIAEVYLIILVV